MAVRWCKLLSQLRIKVLVVALMINFGGGTAAAAAVLAAEQGLGAKKPGVNGGAADGASYKSSGADEASRRYLAQAPNNVNNSLQQRRLELRLRTDPWLR